MKNKVLKMFAILFVTTMAFTSCESTSNVETKDPYFLADMGSIYMGDIVALNKQNFFKPKAISIEVEFYPRTSSVGFFFKDGINKVILTFDPEEYKSLCAGVDKYKEINTAQTFAPNYKPSSKNRFQNGKVSTAWGTTGPSREVEAPYETNYEWLEVNGVENPYFRLKVKATDYPQEEHVGSPTISLYFTPTQAEMIKSIINMEAIMQEVNDFNDAAYSFE